MSDCWHIPEQGGHPAVAALPPGLYAEDRATLDLLLADPAIEHATTTQGMPSPLLHGMPVFVATPDQVALLRASPANRPLPPPEPEQDWEAIRARAEAFLREISQDHVDEMPANAKQWMRDVRRPGPCDSDAMMSELIAGMQTNTVVMDAPSVARKVTVPPGLNRRARRRETAKARRK